jgi:integrase/recombinase XerC
VTVHAEVLEDELLSVDDLVTRYGLEPIPARKVIERRLVPVVKVGPAARQSHADIAAYLEFLRASSRARSTVSLRLSQLSRLAEAFPSRSLRSLTTRDLVTFVSKPDWSTGTAYSFRATLKDFYGMLFRDGVIRSNVAAELPRITVRNRIMLPAPEDSVIDREDLGERTQLMLDLGARQGLRRGEIAQIHSRDLYRDSAGWLLIVHGKGSKDRVIPLHDDIADRIRANGPGWLFPSSRGYGHLVATSVGKILTDSLPEGVTAHSLRRRFATKIYTETNDVRAVQQLLGHTSLDVTQRYIGPRPDSMRAAIAHS